MKAVYDKQSVFIRMLPKLKDSHINLNNFEKKVWLLQSNKNLMGFFDESLLPKVTGTLRETVQQTVRRS